MLRSWWVGDVSCAAASLLLSVADVVWPRRCTLCGDAKLVDDSHELSVDACAAHARLRTLWEPGAGLARAARCHRCMAALPPGVLGAAICRDCRGRPPAFVATLCAFHYEPSGIGDWILRFKHGGRRDLARPLARMMMRALKDRDIPGPVSAPTETAAPSKGDLFVPVPLHPVRLAERGYDQAALLADEIAGLCGGQTLALLKRTRATPVQGDLAAPPRRLNVQGAFTARCRLPAASGRGQGRLWLVDDVMTSGATASACAAALRSAGAREVHVLAIARA